jgi:hypothetical protein
VPLASAARGIERHYRVGPANRSYGDPSFTHAIIAFDGVGLRPYRPVHLRATRRPDGGIELTWVRRTRVDGDGWQGAEVPLGEDAEAYVVRIGAAGVVLRELTVGTPRAVYAAAEQAEDGATGPVLFEVAQVSARFGPGPFGRIEFHG